MKKRNLELASDIIIKSLNSSKIEEIDKLELMINLYYFLDSKEYDKNIKVLRKNRFENKKKI